YFVQGVSCRVGQWAIPVLNLSRGGFFATTEKLPSPGQTIAHELEFPQGARLGVQSRGGWGDQATAAGGAGLPRGFGGEIVRLEEMDQHALRAFLKRSDPVRGPAVSW